MTNALIVLLLWQGVFRLALPGFEYSFPRDHGNHPGYRLEWWYWTGHLTSEKGRRFGFELTFFRLGIRRDSSSVSNWAIGDLYPAHFALTDIDNGRFFHTQKLSRTGPGTGSSSRTLNIWNQQWRASLEDGKIRLQASSKGASLDLQLKSLKDPIIHGWDGVSQKGSQPGQASHYYSLTRLSVLGRLGLDGHSHDVQGQAWMDHEFGTSQLSDKQIGWDWFSLQLDNHFEVMLYRLRRRNGFPDPNSGGTVVSPEGRASPLESSQFQLRPTHDWTSHQTGIQYPVGWQVSIPEYDAVLSVIPLVENQELDTRTSTGIIYWEGAVEIRGLWKGREVTGLGYLELTGYGDGGRPNV